MDLTQSISPRTDQQNFDSYLTGPKTLTISEVKAGTAEQPIEIHLVEFPGQPYKPSKSMRRVLVHCWGPEASVYAGRRITLYGDPSVRFGSAVVGGLKISHLSHIKKPEKVNLTVTRGKREMFTVQPLETPTSKPSRDWLAELTLAGNDLDAVSALGQAASKAGASMDVLKQIRDQYTALKGAQNNEVQA